MQAIEPIFLDKELGRYVLFHFEQGPRHFVRFGLVDDALQELQIKGTKTTLNNWKYNPIVRLLTLGREFACFLSPWSSVSGARHLMSRSAEKNENEE